MLASHDRVAKFMQKYAPKDEDDQNEGEHDRGEADPGSDTTPIDQHPQEDEGEGRVQPNVNVVDARHGHGSHHSWRVAVVAHEHKEFLAGKLAPLGTNCRSKSI
jgi:hypothetical protein